MKGSTKQPIAALRAAPFCVALGVALSSPQRTHTHTHSVVNSLPVVSLYIYLWVVFEYLHPCLVARPAYHAGRVTVVVVDALHAVLRRHRVHENTFSPHLSIEKETQYRERGRVRTEHAYQSMTYGPFLCQIKHSEGVRGIIPNPQRLCLLHTAASTSWYAPRGLDGIP